jgi:hypothetical protein
MELILETCTNASNLEHSELAAKYEMAPSTIGSIMENKAKIIDHFNSNLGKSDTNYFNKAGFLKFESDKPAAIEAKCKELCATYPNFSLDTFAHIDIDSNLKSRGEMTEEEIVAQTKGTQVKISNEISRFNK